MMFGMMLIWLLLLGLGVVVVAQLFPGARHRAGQDNDGPGALEILARRYARGELTREQYELMRRDLGARGRE